MVSGWQEELLASVALSAELSREHFGGQEGEELTHAIPCDTANRVFRAMGMGEERMNLLSRLLDRVRETVFRVFPHSRKRKRKRAMTT